MKKLTTILCLMLLTLSLLAQEPVKEKCKGTTTKGQPCQLTPSKETNDGYCRFHSPKTPRCGAKTKSGEPCKMTVKKAGEKCHLHTEKPSQNGNNK